VNMTFTKNRSPGASEVPAGAVKVAVRPSAETEGVQTGPEVNVHGVEGDKHIGLEQKPETADPAPCRRPHGFLTLRDFPRQSLNG
jgi:hypothetical protein